MKRSRTALRRGGDDRWPVNRSLEIADILLAGLENAPLGKLPVEKPPLDGTASLGKGGHHKNGAFFKDLKLALRVNGTAIFQSGRRHIPGGTGQNKFQFPDMVVSHGKQGCGRGRANSAILNARLGFSVNFLNNRLRPKEIPGGDNKNQSNKKDLLHRTHVNKILRI